MSIESDFDFRGLASRLQELGVIEKSFLSMSKEEMVALIKEVFRCGEKCDVPF